MKTLGEKIAESRVNVKLKQADLASLINVTIYDINNWENNLSEPTLDQINKLASALYVSTEFLLNNDDSNENVEKEDKLPSTKKKPINKFTLGSCDNCDKWIFEGNLVHTIELVNQEIKLQSAMIV